MTGAFSIKVGEFEGPLDLLLQLIERNKLHISEVSLAQVADEYLKYVSASSDLPKHDLADFLMVASTLIFIKSLSLLPTLEKTPEETSDIEELERRLKIYQRFKELGELIRVNFGKQRLFFREEKKNIEPVFMPTKEVSPPNLLTAIQNVFKNLPKKEIIPQAIVRKVVSLETVIENLTKRIQSSLRLTFKDFVGDQKTEKINIVVSFLGMLELLRSGLIEATQDGLFNEIHLENNEPGIPRYY